MRDTQRGLQSYMKKKRGRREIEISRRKKRRTQEERDRSTQFSVPRVFSVAQRESQNWLGKRSEKEEIEVF